MISFNFMIHQQMQLKKFKNQIWLTTLSYVTRNYTGDGSTAAFTVTSGTAVDNVLVMENGIVQKPTSDYTISGTTLTFTTVAATGVAIQIRELLKVRINIRNDN